MVDAFISVMETEDDVTGPINLGNPDEFSIRQLADLILEITGSKSEIVSRPLPQDDPVQRCPDIAMAKETINWAPTVKLRQGLEQTIEWFASAI